MTDNSIQLDSGGSILFVGNSYTFGRVDPVMSYNSDHVRDLTAPVPGTTFANTTGSNPYEPHPWGGVPGLFEAFAEQSGLQLDVAISARNAATLQGQYLNSNPAGWDLRGNVASRRSAAPATLSAKPASSVIRMLWEEASCSAWARRSTLRLSWIPCHTPTPAKTRVKSATAPVHLMTHRSEFDFSSRSLVSCSVSAAVFGVGIIFTNAGNCSVPR